MARLSKFKGPDRLPDVARPAVVADTAVGVATEAFGRQIQRSATQVGRLGELLRQRQEKIDALEREYVKTRVDAALRGWEEEERKTLQPGAAGYAQAMMSHHAQEWRSAIEAQSERLRPHLVEEFEGQKDRYLTRFAGLEYSESRRLVRQRIDEILHVQAASVTEDPVTLDAAMTQFASVLDKSPLPAEDLGSARRQGAKTLVETWVKTLDPAQRMAILSASGDPASPEVRSPDAITSVGPEQLALVRELPSRTRRDLWAEAQSDLALAEIRERERLATRIAGEGSALDPDDIRQNTLLSSRAKMRLLALWDMKLRDEDQDLAAVGWSRHPEPGNPHALGDRQQADRAYRYLEAKGEDPHQVALALLRDKRVLPDVYASDLAKGLRSADPGDLQAAYENLSDLSLVDPAFAQTAAFGSDLQDGLLKWRVLTERLGLSAGEAAALLVKANDPEFRRALEGPQTAGPGSVSSFGPDPQTILMRLAALEGPQTTS